MGRLRIILDRSLNQNFNGNNNKVNFVLFAVVISLFAVLVSSQRKELDPSIKISQLLKESQIVLLPKWDVSFESCNPSTLKDCTTAGINAKRITFPASRQITQITSRQLDQGGDPINKAVLEINLDFMTKAWVRSQKAPVNLVIPEFLGSYVSMIYPPTGNTSSAYRHDLVYNIPRTYLNEGLIKLQVYFPPGDLWFGPTNFSPALVTYAATRDYAGIDQLSETTSHLSRLSEVIIPLLIVALSLVINHSVGIMFLSIFAAALALRSVTAMLLEMSPDPVLYHLLAFFYGASVILLVRFILYLAEIKVKRIYAFILPILAGFFNPFDVYS